MRPGMHFGYMPDHDDPSDIPGSALLSLLVGIQLAATAHGTQTPWLADFHRRVAAQSSCESAREALNARIESHGEQAAFAWYRRVFEGSG